MQNQTNEKLLEFSDFSNAYFLLGNMKPYFSFYVDQ